MHRQSKTRAGNHRRHTRTRRTSLPAQANHTARGARKQPPNQGAIHAACEDITHTSNHTACQQCTRRKKANTAPTVGTTPVRRRCARTWQVLGGDRFHLSLCSRIFARASCSRRRRQIAVIWDEQCADSMHGRRVRADIQVHLYKADGPGPRLTRVTT